MKKMICAAFAATLILSLAACSGSSDSETSIPSTEGNPTQTTTEATAQPADAVDLFDEIVLAENENVSVKITDVDQNNFWGYTLKVYLENKTDRELMFTVESVSVNGYMCDPFWAASVAAGKKANEEISFSESDFESNGIEAVEEITFTLRVFDSQDWTADDLFHQTFTVNP